jgi:hypothetical protein
MNLEDFPAFERELKQLCATLGKAYTEPLAKAYWRVLRGVSLSEVEANVERILLNATRETKFPKPSELCSRATHSQQIVASDPDFARMQERSVRMWETWLREDPDLARLELAIARCARILACDHESTPQYAMARQEQWQCMQRRSQLLEQRARERASRC